MPSNQNKLPEEELLKLKVMRDRSPEEWVNRIDSLPSSIRSHAARVVWWDWFGGRTVAERWDHLDHHLNRWSAPDAVPAALSEALCVLGYPKKTANSRAASGPRIR